jgi:TorA maturation chaperone TorD
MATDVRSRCTFDPALSCARQVIYRYCALALADPRTGSWAELCQPASKRLVTDAAELIRLLAVASPEKLAARELPLDNLDPGPMIERLPGTPAALSTIYESAFGLLAAGPCPPLETEYIHSKLTFQRSQQLADVSGFYTAFGLRTSSAHPERHDHITLELEFMASLIGLEREAHLHDGEHRDEYAEVCHKAQKKFLGDHLAWWAPAFARLLALENPGGYYEAVGQLLAALIPAERALLGVAASNGEVYPSSVEPPEQCEGCLLSSQ